MNESRSLSSESHCFQQDTAAAADLDCTFAPPEAWNLNVSVCSNSAVGAISGLMWLDVSPVQPACFTHPRLNRCEGAKSPCTVEGCFARLCAKTSNRTMKRHVVFFFNLHKWSYLSDLDSGFQQNTFGMPHAPAWQLLFPTDDVSRLRAILAMFSSCCYSPKRSFLTTMSHWTYSAISLRAYWVNTKKTLFPDSFFVRHVQFPVLFLELNWNKIETKLKPMASLAPSLALGKKVATAWKPGNGESQLIAVASLSGI